MAYFDSSQEHLPTWRTEGFLILLMNCIYLHYITYIPRINKCLEEFKNQLESLPYPLKETVLQYSCILLVCLRMNSLVMLEWTVYLIPIAHMNMTIPCRGGRPPDGSSKDQCSDFFSTDGRFVKSRNTLQHEDRSGESTYPHC